MRIEFKSSLPFELIISLTIESNFIVEPGG
jgi:hypothetical protein